MGHTVHTQMHRREETEERQVEGNKEVFCGKTGREKMDANWFEQMK